MDEDEHEQPEDWAEEEPAEEPRTKSDLYRLFNNKGPTVMISRFMSDPELRYAALIILDVSYPLENSYYSTLEALSHGWQEQMSWTSNRALGDSWVATVASILQTLESEKIHDHLDMGHCLRSEVPPEILPDWAADEVKRLEKAALFATKLSEHWLWSNIFYFYHFPSVAMGFLSEDPARRDMIFNHMGRLASAVNAAEMEYDRRKNGNLKRLLFDLGYNRQPLAREVMALVLQEQRDELRKVAKRLAAGSPSTKDLMENAFAFLKRRSVVNSSANKFSDWTKYCYTIINPYPLSSGNPQILPSKSDFSTLHGPQGLLARQQAHRTMFSPQATLFPAPHAVPKPQKIYAAGFRPAGVEAQQRASAAAAFLLHDAMNRWSHIDLCWVGVWSGFYGLEVSSFFEIQTNLF